MKHIAVLVFVVVMVVICTGAASAGQPTDGTFTIRGYTTDYTFHKLPSGLTAYHLLANSSGAPVDDPTCQAMYGMPCLATCPATLGAECGVTGYFNGQFNYEEWGTIDYDPITGVGSGEGRNVSLLTVNTSKGKVSMRLGGKLNLQRVWGHFVLQNDGTGAYRGLHGAGAYTGNGGMIFAVTFTGNLH